MKKILLYTFLVAMILFACKGIKTVNSDMEEEQLGCENEISTAILWVDRTGNESLMKYGFVRTAKVHANVYSDGTFRIMSFCKKQEPEVVEYLKKRVSPLLLLMTCIMLRKKITKPIGYFFVFKQVLRLERIMLLNSRPTNFI